MATRIGDVGLQVWPSCVLLCDYILSEAASFKDKIVLELGAGLGLPSIFLSTVSKLVLVTDIGNDVLEMCLKNVQSNKQIMQVFNREDDISSVIKVREYNWLDGAINKQGKFGWSDEDIEMLSRAEIIVAADVIYDNALTDAFITRLKILLQNSRCKAVYIAVEKRLNFTIDDMDVTCPAYTYFMEKLKEIKEVLMANLQTPRNLKVEKLDNNFPECLSGFFSKRSKYMELWKIWAD